VLVAPAGIMSLGLWGAAQVAALPFNLALGNAHLGELCLALGANALLCGSVAFAVGGMTGSRGLATGVASVVLGFGWLLASLLPQWSQTRDLAQFIPWYWYSKPVVLVNGLDGGYLALMLGVAATLLAAGVWAVMGFAGPVSNHPSQLGYVHDVIVSARQTRVLMIEAKSDGGLKWNVADSSQPTWGTAERNPVGAFYDDFAALVQLFGGGDTPEDLADRLKALGVGHVWMKGFSAEQLAAVGNAAGLTSAPLDQDVVIWTVVELPARARIIDGESSQAVLEGYVSASGAERRLVLAEPSDDRWRVSIGGQELSRISGDENVSFTVPAGAEGQLSWQLAPSWGTFGLQIGVVVLIAGLAAPTIGGSSAARRGLEE